MLYTAKISTGGSPYISKVRTLVRSFKYLGVAVKDSF